tara:strand:+ start:1917 stop:2219 length:303 start_codon:yes stop_codon:yes gene_type:complete
MSKFNQFFDTHGTKVVIALGLLIYFKTCSTDRSVDKLDRKVEIVQIKSDSLKKTIDYKLIDRLEMIELIKETPAWRTLEIEELSDKHSVPINAYKNKEEN